MAVAVIIPTFNQARFLGDAINSVLAQTRLPDEIIVVDDGSIDDAATVVAQFPNVRLIRQENRGLSGARNTGLRNATASHVVFLDSGDRLMPRAIEAGLACIAGQPDCAFVYGGFRLISEHGRIIGPDYVDSIDGDARLAFLRGGIITPSMVLFRRDRLLEINGFDETLRRVDDPTSVCASRKNIQSRVTRRSLWSLESMIRTWATESSNSGPCSGYSSNTKRAMLRTRSRFQLCERAERLNGRNLPPKWSGKRLPSGAHVAIERQ